MGATAVLTHAKVTVSPGEQATCEVKVRNTGSVVDQVTFEVLGDAAGWTRCEPPTLSLFPGAEGTTKVIFAPPRSSDVRGGEIPFAVRVTSKEDPEGSVVEEGTVTVGTFSDASAELLPRTSRGRKGALHEIALDNRGNLRTVYLVEGTDADGQLDFDPEPAELIAEPNTASFGKVRIKARRTFLRGAPQTRQFQIALTAEGQPPIVLPATFLQEPRIPKWLPKLLLALLALILLLVLLWFTVLKPEIKSAAKEALQEEQAAAAPTIGGGGGGSDGGGGGAPAASGGTAGGGSATGTPAGAPISGPLRLEGSGSKEYVVPDGKVLQLTDIILQNPGGATGTLEIKRDDDIQLTVALDNFRDIDYHFVAPILFTAGQKLVIVANCTGGGACTPAAYFSGFLA